MFIIKKIYTYTSMNTTNCINFLLGDAGRSNAWVLDDVFEHNVSSDMFFSLIRCNISFIQDDTNINKNLYLNIGHLVKNNICFDKATLLEFLDTVCLEKFNVHINKFIVYYPIQRYELCEIPIICYRKSKYEKPYVDNINYNDFRNSFIEHYGYENVANIFIKIQEDYDNHEH